MTDYKAKVTRVLDGDTFDCTLDLGFDIYLKQRCRMTGMDTPESRTRDKEEKYRGLLSKAYLKDLLKTAKNNVILRCDDDDETGKFGRVLADVIYIKEDGSELNLNKEMIDKGYAVEYKGQSKDDIKDEHLANKQKLIDSGIYTYQTN
tara:strand:- start:11825 stop:12268 length:444 start_codon:yes stop_codon:yes gene_type:complete